jgi:hypothetical protein
MPDLAVPYTLVTPAGTVVFNDGDADQFYIQDIQGLDGAPIRAPVDDAPFTDGGLSYNFWKGARHIVFDGMFLVTSVPPCPAAVAIWNEMMDELREALDSISATIADTGTLSWSPTGLGLTRTLVVRNDVALETSPDQNYQARTFTFSLRADDPVWTEST